MSVSRGAFSEHARSGARLDCRVTPAARQEVIAFRDGRFHIRVTAVAEGGRANKAVVRLLARALGVPTGRLKILRGGSGRDKIIALD